MEFRGYRPGDFEALFALDVACFEEVYRFSRRMMRWSLERKGALVVIAEEQGIVGFVVVHVERGGVGYVVTLDVAEAWRRKGLAGDLVQRVEIAAAEAACGEMVLHVAVGNEPAIRFYERCGFERVERETGFYGDGGDAWLYRKGIEGGG